MADYQSIHTGQEIDNAVSKASKLPTVSSSDNGKALQVDSNGNIVAVSGGGTQLYMHVITFEKIALPPVHVDATLYIIATTGTPFTIIDVMDAINSPTTIRMSLTSGVLMDRTIIGANLENGLYYIDNAGEISTFTIDDLSWVSSDAVSTLEDYDSDTPLDEEAPL